MRKISALKNRNMTKKKDGKRKRAKKWDEKTIKKRKKGRGRKKEIDENLWDSISSLNVNKASIFYKDYSLPRK